MYAFIEGELAELSPTHAVVNCLGVGYLLHISLTTFEEIQGKKACRLHTHLVVKEDDLSLYGFSNPNERHIFQMLITVSGIGPSTARTMLSTLPADELQHAILNGNVPLLKSVKGVGAKTAQRMVLELQDKLAKTSVEVGVGSTTHHNRDEALNALVMLGFTKPMAEKALLKVSKQEGGNQLSVEDLIKQALKAL